MAEFITNKPEHVSPGEKIIFENVTLPCHAKHKKWLFEWSETQRTNEGISTRFKSEIVDGPDFNGAYDIWLDRHGELSEGWIIAKPVD